MPASAASRTCCPPAAPSLRRVRRPPGQTRRATPPGRRSRRRAPPRPPAHPPRRPPTAASRQPAWSVGRISRGRPARADWAGRQSSAAVTTRCRPPAGSAAFPPEARSRQGLCPPAAPAAHPLVAAVRRQPAACRPCRQASAAAPTRPARRACPPPAADRRAWGAPPARASAIRAGPHRPAAFRRRAARGPPARATRPRSASGCRQCRRVFGCLRRVPRALSPRTPDSSGPRGPAPPPHRPAARACGHWPPRPPPVTPAAPASRGRAAARRVAAAVPCWWPRAPSRDRGPRWPAGETAGAVY